ncbi:MAG: hypothetical protein ACR2J8_01365 [Thermomicrobiales bacterium]
MTEETTSRRRGKVRVAVLFGGQSGEHDVSLRSAQTVMAALDPARYEIIPVGITRDGQWLTSGDPIGQLTASSPLFAASAASFDPNQQAIVSAPGALPQGLSSDIDVVFPVLHGPMGEDGTVQGLLELAGLPYVGSGVLGSAVGMDKAMTKTILAQTGLPQGPWRLILRKDWERDPAEVGAFIAQEFGFPCFVKPANMGSSVGVVKAHNPSVLEEAMATASRFDRRIFVEA